MLDGDLTAIGLKHMKKMGVRFCLSCPVESVEDSPVGAKVVCRSTNGEVQAFEAEKVLMAVGRGPNTASLGLETGMIKHSKGSILVNDKMETSSPASTLWAIVSRAIHSWPIPPPPWARWLQRMPWAAVCTTTSPPVPPASIWSRRLPL